MNLTRFARIIRVCCQCMSQIAGICTIVVNMDPTHKKNRRVTAISRHDVKTQSFVTEMPNNVNMQNSCSHDFMSTKHIPVPGVKCMPPEDKTIKHYIYLLPNKPYFLINRSEGYIYFCQHNTVPAHLIYTYTLITVCVIV